MNFLILFSIFISAAHLASGQDCFKPDCPSFGILTNQLQSNAVVNIDGPIGTTVSLNCASALDDCLMVESQCSYKTVWHRYADCSNSIVEPGGRFNQVGDRGLQLNIDNLSRQDTGVWACSLKATARNTLMTEVDVYRLFFVHIDDSSVTNSVNSISTGLQCGGLEGQSWNCNPGEICYRHKIMSDGQQAGTFNTEVQAGCWPIANLPLSVLQSASRNPGMSCTFNNGGLCSQSGLLAAVNSTCCYCFTDNCNYRDADPELHRWVNTNAIHNNIIDKTCEAITGGKITADLFSADAGRQTDNNSSQNKQSDFSILLIMLLILQTALELCQ